MTRANVIHAGWLLTLGVWLVLGMSPTPFHGDETYYLWSSRDWHTFAVERDFDALSFDSEQYENDPLMNIRLMNAPLSRYLPGIGWWVAGRRVDELPETRLLWRFEGSWSENLAEGRLPSADSRWLARLPGTLLLTAGAAALFLLGWRLGGVPVAYAASGLFVLNPLVLLHGRRAMAEGALLGISTLTALLIAIYLVRIEAFWRWPQRVAWCLAIGLATGLSFSAKHTGALIGVVYAAALLAVALGSLGLRRGLARALPEIAAIAALALAVNLALSPVFWRAPFESGRRLIEGRAATARFHAAQFGGYASDWERALGAGQSLFTPGHRGYRAEPEDCSTVRDPELCRYSAGPFSGLPARRWIDLPLALLLILGLATMTGRLGPVPGLETRRVRHLVAVWLALMFLVHAVAIHIDWHRYYALLWPPMALTQALGLGLLLHYARRGERGGSFRISVVRSKRTR